MTMGEQFLPSISISYFYFLCIYCSTLFIFFNQNVNANDKALPSCTRDHFDFKILPCDPKTRKRSAIYYLKKQCNLKANDSIHYPAMDTGLPCECQPGYGEKQLQAGKLECTKCTKGQFSHGGELIDNWKNWNGTNGVPGSGYTAYPYCSDFLTGKDCESWKPGGNFEYLVSGNVKNRTSELKCFEQSILVITRNFVRKLGENKITFKFKVDGAPCRRGSTVCSNGLYFFVNGVRKLKKDVQFMWKEFSVNDIKPGGNEFKFVYHHSCVKEDIQDVAFIKHISMIGTISPNTICNDCPPGSFSKDDGASECTKCSQNYFQNKPGQTECLKCKDGEYSRIGATKCLKLPDCMKTDYYLLPDPISTCKKVGDKWMRKLKAKLPKWAGDSNYPCIDKPDLKPSEDPVQCRCSPGFFLNVKGGTPKCEKCEKGKHSDGTLVNECKSCGEGQAAIPGKHFASYSDTLDYVKDDIDILQNVSCSGQFCHQEKDHWKVRGNYISTSRLPGNFEIKTDTLGFNMSYHAAKLSFKCSVNCQMSPANKRLAKHDHCFLKFILKRNNEVIKAEDCVNRYKPHLRNGSIQSHSYDLTKPGMYRFITIFHHEDEGNYSLVSYEARLYDVEIFGVKSGAAKSCVVCKAGTKLSKTKDFCIPCEIGTFSKNASSKCNRCPDRHFADKPGSAQCTPCGQGTKSNEKRDGCDYNGCKFQAADGVTYDLSPLRRDGGSMYKVENYAKKTQYHFPLVYYVNICSHKHDNSSCMSYKRKMDPVKRKLVVFETTFLHTMACKRWSFDSYHSYSIGEVMHFLPLKGNITKGLMINITGGYKCFHKVLSVYVKPSTSILMQCDLSAGVGKPEPRSNLTAIDEKHCHYELRWRTLYACPLCTNKDYVIVQSKCINGTRILRKTRIVDCRPAHGVSIMFSRTVKCTDESSVLSQTLSQTPLIITIVVAVILIIILIIFVIYYIRRNRTLRGRLFSKAFHKVSREDEDELVDNMQAYST